MGANVVTPWDAISAIAPLVGGAGISGVLIAVFGYLSAARAGRKGEPEKAGLGISALLADSSSVNRLALSIESGTLEMKGLRLLAEEIRDDMKEQIGQAIDEHIKIRRALEEVATCLARQRER